jgi:hypothetical protein
MKKTLLLGLACICLAACDYTTPLVTRPETDIDNAVIGLWQRTDNDGKAESLLVLPWSKREYLVAFPAGTNEAMYARGCLWRGADRTLVQLDWFGTGRGALPDGDGRTFQFVSYKVESNTLRVALLNPEVVSNNLATAEVLIRAVSANKDHPKLFRDDMVFRKAKD